MKALHLILVLASSLSFTSLNAQAYRYDTISTPKQQPQPVYQTEQAATPVEQKPVESSQPKQSSGFDVRRLVFGGSFGMVFGDYTSINVSPQLGYQFNRYVTAGGGVSYNYYHSSGNNGFGNNYTYNYLGLNLYSRITPVRFIALQIQPELYGMWGSQNKESIDTKMVPCILTGGGIILPTGRHGGITAMIMYDVVQNDWSPYGNQLVYTFGYTVGF